MHIKIKFKGVEYLLTGDENDGAIATEEEYRDFLPNYAHLFSNGVVMRYGEVIGSKDDIEFIEANWRKK